MNGTRPNALLFGERKVVTKGEFVKIGNSVSCEGTGFPLSFGADGAFLGDASPLLDTYKQVFSDGEGNGQTDVDLQKRESRRRNGVKVAEKLRRAGMVKRADKMEGCGRDFHRATCIKCGVIQTFAQSFACEDRLCPSCASRRAGRLSARWKRALDAFQGLQEGCHAYFLTLTFKDTDFLQAFATYTKPRRLLFRHPYWKQFGLIGGISAFETKLGKRSGLWHSHFHCVLFTRKPIELIETGEHKGQFQNSVNEEISELWLSLTGGSFIVKGQAFDGNTQELVKYLTKAGEELPDARLAELATWARGKRFISTFGRCYNNKAMRDAMNDEEKPGKLHRCECGCDDFEVASFGWSDKLNSFICENVRRVHLSPDDSPPGEKKEKTTEGKERRW